MDQFEHVKKIVDARRCGDDVAVSKAEKNYIRQFIGEKEVSSDDAMEPEGHQDYDGMTALERMEALAGALFEKFDQAKHAIDSQDALTRKQWHPFFTSSEDIGLLWGLRKTLDEIGIPYTLFAYAALADWLMYKKLRRFPTMSELTDKDIILTALDFWAEPEFDVVWDGCALCPDCEAKTLH